MKRQVVRGDGRLQRCKNKNLAAWADLENRAAAVANVQIVVVIERDACSDAHAFDPLLGAAIGRDAMDGAVVAAGDKEIAPAVERQAAGIHQRRDEWLHAVISRDFVKRNGNALAPRARKRDENIAIDIDRGIRNGMKVIRDLQSDVYRMWRRFLARRGHRHHSFALSVGDREYHAIFAGEGDGGLPLSATPHPARLPARKTAP